MPEALKVCLVTPYYLPTMRGNSITVDRIAQGLLEREVDVGIVTLEKIPEGEPTLIAQEFEPDIVHGFHATRSALAVAEMVATHPAPVVTTLTGTDVNHDLLDPDRRDVVLESLRRSTRIVVFHDSMKQKLLSAAPEFEPRVVVIQQTVRLAQEAFEAGFIMRFQGDEVVFLLSAGIRAVKNVLFPIAPLTRLHERYPNLRLVYAGPIIEFAVYEQLTEAMEGEDWISYIGVVKHDRMKSLLNVSDVALNTSISEGGMANSVLEAMGCGVPVLASDIEGNRSIVEEGVTGFLYSDESDFEAKAERLIADEELRLEMGRAAQEKMRREFNPKQEIEEYLRVYREVLEERSGVRGQG